MSSFVNSTLTLIPFNITQLFTFKLTNFNMNLTTWDIIIDIMIDILQCLTCYPLFFLLIMTILRANKFKYCLM